MNERNGFQNYKQMNKKKKNETQKNDKNMSVALTLCQQQQGNVDPAVTLNKYICAQLFKASLA